MARKMGEQYFRNMQKQVYELSDSEFKTKLAFATDLTPTEVSDTKLLRLNGADAKMLLSWDKAENIKNELIELIDDGLLVMTERNGEVYPVKTIDLYYSQKGLGNKLMGEGQVTADKKAKS